VILPTYSGTRQTGAEQALRAYIPRYTCFECAFIQVAPRYRDTDVRSFSTATPPPQQWAFSSIAARRSLDDSRSDSATALTRSAFLVHPIHLEEQARVFVLGRGVIHRALAGAEACTTESEKEARPFQQPGSLVPLIIMSWHMRPSRGMMKKDMDLRGRQASPCQHRSGSPRAHNKPQPAIKSRLETGQGWSKPSRDSRRCASCACFSFPPMRETAEAPNRGWIANWTFLTPRQPLTLNPALSAR
jgi:hypothetical protein